MDSSPETKPMMEPSLPAIAGVKRPATSLLPAFEPLSSSPGLPRPTKRQALEGSVARGVYQYPTPVPTSSTGILSSSPPRVSRPAPQRTLSTSDRAPLSALPSVELNENGETLLMGRSSNSSHYQLSANRLISRVHVRARYIAAASSLESHKVEIVCNGWNGLMVHCQGRTWELAKGDTFTSETESVEIMLDVQEARVLVKWPKRCKNESLSESSWEDSPGRITATRANGGSLQSSPLRRAARLTSPESPTPHSFSSLKSNSADQIHIYEDPCSADEQELPQLPSADVGSSFMTEATTKSFSSDDEDNENHDDDPNEENDPIVHSFGPYGANLSKRMADIFTSPTKRIRPSPHATRKPISNIINSTATVMASIETAASKLPTKASNSRSSSSSSKRENTTPPPPAAAPERAAAPTIDLTGFDIPTISNHVVNQLAYSRLSSTPLSAILTQLPSEAKRQGNLSKSILRHIIEEKISCIGTIPRQGKDAAGKPLESEYYYMPEKDDDEFRRLAVTDGMRKPSLRNCRKQHKQYYWKRPRTP